MPKYYCLLCETSHPEVKPSIKCPNCGRIFCQDSIDQSFSVGKTGCPYCDHSLAGIEKSNQFFFQGKDLRSEMLSSLNILKKQTKGSNKRGKQEIAIYILIACMILPFLVIIGLMFLRVFWMFFEIFSI